MSLTIHKKFWKGCKKVFHRPSPPPPVLFTPAFTPRAPVEKDDDNHGRTCLSLPRSPKRKAQRATELLPPELWRKILRYTLRLTGADAIDLKDPFQSEYLQEDYPNIHPGYFEDRRSCRHVCRIFNSLVTEIMIEYIVVHTQAELDWTISTLEKDVRTTQHKALGEWTTRIDFCISGVYDPESMVRLFTLTPNLIIYTMNTGRGESPEHSMNPVILRGLIDFHKDTLKRLDWAGVNDAPTYADLHLIDKNFASLTTLHLRCLYSLPQRDANSPALVFRSLKSLSLGLIPLIPPPQVTSDLFPNSWDSFLMYLAWRPIQLPKLERFDTDICPLPDFFSTHGYKLRTFKTTSWSAQGFLEPTFELSPNLETFLYVYHTDPQPHIPLYHPTLRRIGITPLIENYVEVPEKFYQHYILKALDNLLANVEDINAQKLTDVRICDQGAFTGIFERDDTLFWHWCNRLRGRRNVQLQNKFGDLNERYAKFGDVPPQTRQGYSILPERLVSGLPPTESGEPCESSTTQTNQSPPHASQSND